MLDPTDLHQSRVKCRAAPENLMSYSLSFLFSWKPFGKSIFLVNLGTLKITSGSSPSLLEISSCSSFLAAAFSCCRGTEIGPDHDREDGGAVQPRSPCELHSSCCSNILLLFHFCSLCNFHVFVVWE